VQPGWCTLAHQHACCQPDEEGLHFTSLVGKAFISHSLSCWYSSLQGFELADPTKLMGDAQPKERSGTESYFSSLSGFRSVKKLA
jgi:hypothetical protein